ncbi:unnamed protein product [Rotaria sp. Silwood1]|nr:unnamed protein product [Rotaria sp. Silwood1]CAF3713301.1 unnamed protein product [Rotaria sp. Silwood1]CAF4702393.1 unnamed protein product [Rotaria sp. Silwood1]
MLCLLIIFIVVLFFSYRLYQHFFPTPNINPNGKYVLISGCDSGFGNGLAIELDKQGFNVFAGVFLPDNVAFLREKLSSKATVFRLDITKQEDIDGAFELVNKKTKVLHGLVNNAGIAVIGHIDWTSMEDMRKVMDVNYFGHVAMTKKFLPLLIAKRDSRVANICSIAGYLSLSGASAYCASKYAFESFSDCLRREMAPWGLHVSIIEPGAMQTPILQSGPQTFSEFYSMVSSDAQERWGKDFLKGHYDKSATNVFAKYAEDPMKVIRALQHAVMNTVPRIRYRPGWQSSLVFYPISNLPTCIVDWLLSNLDNLYQRFFPTPNINPNDKYVLISGCDSEFGHGLAIELDKQGFNVLADVFLPDNVAFLREKLSSKATVFRLDITKQLDIDGAFELVNKETKVLHALVNNAGIAILGNIDWASMEDMRKVMDVNYFGHVAMTKKFLPLLIAKRDSRVVNICSVASYLASASMSAYCALKYAEDPMKVVRALQHAVMNTVPRIRYRPGWQSSLGFFPESHLPAWVVDWLLSNLDKSFHVPAFFSQQLKD